MNKLLLLPLLFVGCVASTSTLKTPRLLAGKTLNSALSSPDGYTVAPDSSLLVSINQKASSWANPAVIARINPDETLDVYYKLPVDSTTGVCSPLGLVFASDGNLYVSDNQSFFTTTPNSSSVLCIVHENGKPTKSRTVATGFNMSNGLAAKGDYIYVAETNLGTTDCHTSGIYRFKLSEFTSDSPVRVTGLGDPHLILNFTTEKQGVGANGVAFDSKGNLYVNNFGDFEIMKYEFNSNDEIISSSVMPIEGAESADGLQIDSEDNLWVADFIGNAVIMVDSKTGKSTIISKNSVPQTGEDGLLDAPSECIMVGNKVYVSNIDIDHGQQTADKIQTISVIDL